jgi:predicted TIM-barrel fold metal-dependent hydrolase
MTDKLTKSVGKPEARGRNIPIIDCDFHHTFPSNDVFLSYLDPKWHDYFRVYGARGAQPVKFNGAPYPRSQSGDGARRDARPPSGARPGSDLEFAKQQVLDTLPIEFAILNLGGAPGTSLNYEYDAAMARAANRFTEEQWLARDNRFLASICVPFDAPELAAKEIDYWAERNPKFISVYIYSHTAQPFGRQFYWPIFEAAQRNGLTISFHLGPTATVPLTASGWPSYYIEEHTLNCGTFPSQLISIVCEGVFERFPNLRLVSMEGGFAWAASLMWRMDKQWKRLQAEMPNLKRLPSEIIREHVRFTTQPMEEPSRPEQLLEIIEHMGEDMLMFSTDYPHWDFDNPTRAFQTGMSNALRTKIYNGNARKLWNLPEGYAAA